MPTLSVLLNNLISEDQIPEALKLVPGWELIRSSGVNGQTKPYFLALGARGLKVMAEWPDSAVQQFHSLWPGMRLVSLQLSDKVYGEVIAAIQSKTVTTAPEVV